VAQSQRKGRRPQGGTQVAHLSDRAVGPGLLGGIFVQGRYQCERCASREAGNAHQQQGSGGVTPFAVSSKGARHTRQAHGGVNPL